MSGPFLVQLNDEGGETSEVIDDLDEAHEVAVDLSQDLSAFAFDVSIYDESKAGTGDPWLVATYEQGRLKAGVRP